MDSNKMRHVSLLYSFIGEHLLFRLRVIYLWRILPLNNSFMPIISKVSFFFILLYFLLLCIFLFNSIASFIRSSNSFSSSFLFSSVLLHFSSVSFHSFFLFFSLSFSLGVALLLFAVAPFSLCCCSSSLSLLFFLALLFFSLPGFFSLALFFLFSGFLLFFFRVSSLRSCVFSQSCFFFFFSFRSFR